MGLNQQLSSTVRVDVELGERSYPILVGSGLLNQAGAEVANVFPKARLAIVTDETVAGHYLDTVLASIQAAGLEAVPIVVEPGETTKSFKHLEQVTRALLAARLERGDVVVALGGGVVGDLTGFAAAIARRGMAFVQMPTSLLAQVDSSVGGKTGINTPEGKNLVGAFHQPGLVLADTDALNSLSEREFKAGYAEVVKYGLIDDRAFFEWLEAKWREVFSGGEARTQAIAKSCQAKARVVAADEREAGQRALLNLGHTFGHALEKAVAYDPNRLVHGEGVAIGMAIAFRFSTRLGLCPGQSTERVVQHLEQVGLPTHIGSIPGEPLTLDVLMQAIAQDKKVSRGALTFILTRDIGASFVAKDVDPADVAAHLEDELRR